MKEYIPDYYKDFQCIADKCKDSCCIGWEIMIDSKSYKKYQNVKGEFRDRLMKGIDHEGTPAFHLDDRDRCVFLNVRYVHSIRDFIMNMEIFARQVLEWHAKKLHG